MPASRNVDTSPFSNPGSQILPREAYICLFEAMYNTLVPTTEGSEAEDAAKWDYSEDARHLPEALTRVGITREAFSDALFAAVDNVSRTLATRTLPTVLYLRVCAASSL